MLRLEVVWFERVHRPHGGKRLGPKPFDYISTDLDYKLLKQKREALQNS